MTTTPSADGRWELRSINNYTTNDAGYGNGDWHFELVERATGRIVRDWSGGATCSPWNSESHGVSSVHWDGDTLVVVAENIEERVKPDCIF